jgi:hypothetical protein
VLEVGLVGESWELFIPGSCLPDLSLIVTVNREGVGGALP